MGLLVFFGGLLELDAVDLDAVQLGGEVLIKQKLVSVVNVSPPGFLVEHAYLRVRTTGKYLHKEVSENRHE